MCVNYGQRVQNSVFECSLNEAQYRVVQHELSGLIDPKTDSLRFYNLGSNYKNRLAHIGARPSYDAEGTWMV